MNRKMLMSMLVLSIALVAIPSHATAASSAPYAVPPNQTLPFFVMANDASLHQTTGEAFIVAKVPIEGGFLRVDVRCDSLVPCTGLVVGQ